MYTTINECKVKSKTILTLERWAHNTRVSGFVLMVIIVIYGFVSGFMAADATYKDQAVGAFFGAFLPIFLCAYLELFAFFAVALVIEVLAVISHNTSTTAALTELMAANKGIPYGQEIVCTPTAPGNFAPQKAYPPSATQKTSHTPSRTPLGNEWKCPSCGRINQSYVGTCGCGQRKP